MSASKLCELCSRITAEALASKHGYRHAQNIRQLDLEECPLCMILASSFPSTPFDPLPFDEHKGRDLRLSLSELQGTESYHLSTSLELNGEVLNNKIENFHLFTSIGDPATKYGIQAIRRDLTNTGSENTVGFIRSCLEECNSRHDCTWSLRSSPFVDAPHLSKNVVRPARLISLSDQNQSLVHLVETKNRQVLEYMTLSHCWGKNLPEDCLTTTSNLESRLRSLAVSTLPPSFRDAINITRRLGVQYLWIDTLCIMQDSKEDWAIESVKMGGIYQGSVLTIAATQAEDSFGGCYNQQSTSRDRVKMEEEPLSAFEINGEDASGTFTKLILFEDTEAEPWSLAGAAINKRGWVYQERILSPRTAHFTASQVIWECRNAFWFEDGIPWRDRLSTNTHPSLLRREDMSGKHANFWYSELISRQYSHGKFTKPSDRLPALSGLASAYQALNGDRYIAGVWEKTLEKGLSWNFKHADECKPPTPRRWPSWSWASHDEPVEFSNLRHTTRADHNFELVDVQLDFSPGYVNEFSPVEGGFITITGSLVTLVLEGEHTKLAGLEVSYWLDYEQDDGSVQIVTALVLQRISLRGSSYRDEYLLLEPYGARDSSYMRKGWAITNWFALDEEDPGVEYEAEASARKPQTINLY